MSTHIVFGEMKKFAIEIAHVSRSWGVEYTSLDDPIESSMKQDKKFLFGGVRIWVNGKYFGQICAIDSLGCAAASLDDWSTPSYIPTCKNRKRLVNEMKLNWARVAEKFRLKVELGPSTDEFCISTFRSAGYIWFYWTLIKHPSYSYPKHLYKINKGRVEFDYLRSVVHEFIEWVKCNT